MTPEAPFAAAQPPGILVVDDEWEVRTILSEGLRREGFAVWQAADGYEALDLYRYHGESIGAVLLDVRMPGPDGPQTLAALRAIDPQVRCCFVTGDPGRYTVEDLHRLGAAAVLGKPFRLDAVAQVARELVSCSERGARVRAP